MNNRDWQGKPLDLRKSPEDYTTWRSRVLVFLGKDRLDIRQVLVWAETQGKPLGPSEEAAGFTQHGIQDPKVSFALWEGIRHTFPTAYSPTRGSSVTRKGWNFGAGSTPSGGAHRPRFFHSKDVSSKTLRDARASLI